MASTLRGDSTSTNAAGVTGTNSTKGDGVSGQNTADGDGVTGVSQNGNGVHGETFNANMSGVWGKNNAAGNGVLGTSDKSNGVHGESASPNDSGVWGNNSAPKGAPKGYGVAGSSNNTGVYGIGGQNGVHGESASPNDSGVWGSNSAPPGAPKGYGVAGSSDHNIGVYGSGGKLGGQFDGGLQVNGICNVSHDLIAGGVLCLNDSTISGTLHVVKDIILTGGDCAEQFDVSSQVIAEPGTVMVINGEGELEPSQRPYDKRVAGVISGAGDLRPALILDKQQSDRNRASVALVGKVYCKVDATDVAIEVGDLLTTSHTVGHAMKADDPVRAFGTIIGKALRPLRSGTGLIPILVALQ